MNENWTKFIEMLLQGELSPEDTKKLNAELERNPDMRKSLEQQKRVHEIAKRSGERAIVKNVGRSYQFRRKFNTGLMSVVVAGLLATAAYLTVNHLAKKSNGESENVEAIRNSKYEKFDDKAELDNCPIVCFEHDGKDATFMSPKGVLISVPKKTFLLEGKPYKGKAVIQYQEALDATTIVKAGLSTTSGDRLLETQGMFGLKAYTPDGRELKINNKDGIYLQVPVDENKAGMQLFQGVKNAKGEIDWQNPAPIEKMPVQANMLDLDLFPTGFEDKLDELKWNKKKKQRDSLYLSFEKQLIDERPKTSSENKVYAVDSTKSQMLDQTVDLQKLVSVQFQMIGGTGNSFLLSEESNLKNYRLSFSEKGGNRMTVPVFKAEDVSEQKIKVTLAFIPEPYKYKIKRISRLEEERRNAKVKTPPQNNRIIKDPFRFSCENKNIKFSYVKTEVVRNNSLAQMYYQSTYILDLANAINSSFDLKANLNMDIIQSPLDGYSLRFVHQSNNTLKDTAENCYLPPSKVLAIWKKEFNGTILATRDFEKRMEAIHGACNEKVFDVYANQINKPLWQLDEQVVRMGYANFQQFADERVGALKQDNAHMNTLRQFYQSNVSRLKQMAKKDKNFQKAIRLAWDRKFRNERSSSAIRSVKRVEQAYQEEYKMNLNNVLDQLGRKKTVGLTIRGDSYGARPYGDAKTFKPKPIAKGRISNVYNIDRFTRENTRNRTSGEFMDKSTGKKAKLVYKKLKAKIKDAAKYGQLFLYLLPKQLNSFQRINPINGAFDYALNNDIDYDVIFVGVNESGYYMADKKNVSGVNLGEIKLKSVSENEFERRIERMNEKRNSAPSSISSELTWLKTERKDYVIQSQRKKMTKFRNTIRGIVYPCAASESASGGEYYFYPEEEKADAENPVLV